MCGSFIEASVGQRWPWMIHHNVFVFNCIKFLLGCCSVAYGWKDQCVNGSLYCRHLCVVSGRMEQLLSSFLRARLSAAAAISLSSPVLRCCFRALIHFVRSAVTSVRPSHDIVSMSTAFIYLLRRHHYIAGEGTRWCSFPKPTHCRGCLFVMRPSYIRRTWSTIAECTYREDQHLTRHWRWLRCPARIFQGYGGCLSGGMCWAFSPARYT